MFFLFYRQVPHDRNVNASIPFVRYLNDWKERSCLESDQLNMLFGNIEQVCDFNMILLEDLKSSGMEPARIAKCFINLHDQFDAYTHYW